METDWLARALELGFSHAADWTADVRPLPEIRAMCAADKCHAYNKNWTCPPLCGTLEECAARLVQHRSGLLVQTVAQLEDEFDVETMIEAEKAHLAAFHQLAAELRKAEPDALCLGTGGCRICGTCALPEPCRFPERACASLEGYGLLVSDLCKQNGLPYYYGKGTVTYTAGLRWG
ncbi:MAG: DUF2284 domain-containing protein [Oscillospiraceae bacterium]|nr:DUF2284 domain-containing protein [Oscillospiraceae bacterium]